MTKKEQRLMNALEVLATQLEEIKVTDDVIKLIMTSMNNTIVHIVKIICENN